MPLELGGEVVDGCLEFRHIRVDLCLGTRQVFVVRCLQAVKLPVDVLLRRLQVVDRRDFSLRLLLLCLGLELLEFRLRKAIDAPSR
jgi:hypothetical protein